MASKKAATKKATKKADPIYWVVQVRSGMFSWKAHSLYNSYTDASLAMHELEKDSIYGSRGYKVDRVELIK